MPIKVDKKWIDPDMASDSELASEASTRSAQDISHQAQISANATSITNEISTRLNADTVLQNNIDLKYNASNPNNYETPSQLNTRDTNNRSRANHTGSQSANTISNFDAASDARVAIHGGATNNPHGVTKAQIGLSNADNTSDLSKPVSVAQQSALDLKYNASNPNGFETPAQLNARDTANRSRENHTGTILASVVSNFASTVLATILAGLSTATSSAVTAADSVLIALGKLQAQATINASSIANIISTFAATVRATVMTGLSTAINTPVISGDSLVVAIGKLQAQIITVFSNQNTYDAGNATTVATSSTTVWTTHTTLVTPAIVSGDYRLFLQWAGVIASNGRSMEVRITRNGVTIFSAQSKVATAGNDIAGFSKFIKFVALSGVQTFTFDFRTGAAGASTVSATSSDLSLVQEGGV
jgi:hypothetical protein